MLSLSGNNTFTGSVTVNSGYVEVQHNNALGTTAGGTTIANGATLYVNGNGLNIAENLSISGVGPAANQGAIRNVTGSNTLSGTIALTANSQIAVATDNTTLTLSGVISGSHAIDYSGASTRTLVLSGNNTFSGGVTYNTATSGLIKIGHNNALGTGTFTMLNTSTANALDLNGYTISNAVSIAGSGISSGGAIYNSNVGTAAELAGAVTMTANTSIGGAGNITANGVISGAFDLTKVGAGTLTLNAANTYTGDTIINGGTLLMGANNRINSGSDLILGGGTLATGGFDQTFATLTLNANSTIDLGSADSVLTFGNVTLNSHELHIWNWTGNPWNPSGPDQFIINGTFTPGVAANSAGHYENIFFYTDSGVTFWQNQPGVWGGATLNGNELTPPRARTVHIHDWRLTLARRTWIRI